MQKINLSTFIDGYEDGSITDVVGIKDKIYGKQIRYPSKIPSNQRPLYRVVWSDIP